MNEYDETMGASPETVPAGWYPDPLAVASHRYWDGERWTNHVHVEEGARSVAPAPRRDRSQTLIAVGALALAISPFLSWAEVVLVGSLNLFQLTQLAGHGSGLAWGAVLIGALSALGAWTARSPGRARTIGLTMGLLAGAFAAWALLGMTHEVREAHGLVRVSYGPWVAVIGCGTMVVASMLGRVAPSQPRR